MSVMPAGEFYGATSARTEARGIAVSRLDHTCGRKLPIHVHEQAYFSMVLGGSYREQTGRHTIEYDPLTIVYHPPGTGHVDEIGPRGATFLMIETDESVLEDHSCSGRLREGYPVRLPPGSGWAALELLREPAGPLASEVITIDLLAAVVEPEVMRRTSSPPVARVIERTRDEFVKPPTTRELAEEAGVHPVHLARVIRRETGMTLAALVRQRRIERSIALLRTRETLSSIAISVGFSDQAHFTRDFRRVTGFTPAGFRRLL